MLYILGSELLLYVSIQPNIIMGAIFHMITKTNNSLGNDKSDIIQIAIIKQISKWE